MDKTLDRDIIEVLKEKAREGQPYVSKKEIGRCLEEKGKGRKSDVIYRHLAKLISNENSGVEGGRSYFRTRNGNEEEVFLEYRYVNEISDDELRYLIDSVLYSKVIESNQGKTLIKKLQNLSGKTIIQDTNYIGNIKEEIYTDNTQTLKNVQLLQEAIREQKVVSFMFNGYNLEKKLSPKWPSALLLHPYQIVLSNGRYYLMAATDNMVKNETYHLYRIDLLTEVEKTKLKANSNRDVADIYNKKDLIKLTRENPYMFIGEAIDITLRIKKNIVVQIIDWFGKDFDVVEGTETKGNEGTIDIKVKANPEAMKYWVLQYSMNLEVLEPLSFRKEMKEIINDIKNKYDD